MGLLTDKRYKHQALRTTDSDDENDNDGYDNDAVVFSSPSADSAIDDEDDELAIEMLPLSPSKSDEYANEDGDDDDDDNDSTITDFTAKQQERQNGCSCQTVLESHQQGLALGATEAGGGERRPSTVVLDSHGHAMGTSTNAQVAINIIISFLGAGILGMPNAFAQSGWLLGTLALFAVAACDIYCMLLLVKCRNQLQKANTNLVLNGYGDVGRVILGQRGEMVVNACLVVSQIGFATAYIIFIAVNLWSLAKVPTGTTCLLCIPVLALLCQAREMKTLSPFSLVADVSTLFGLSAVLFQDYESFEAFEHNDPIKSFEWSQVLYVFGISLYSLEGVGLVLSLESSCQTPQAFPCLLTSVVSGITLLMAVFGTAGYAAFGEQTLAPITLNMPSGSSLNTFVKAALCLALYFTYPIMMYPVHGIIESWWKRVSQPRSCPNVSYRVALVILTAIVAYLVPDFGKFLSLVGSSICVILGFIFPCYFHLHVFWNTLPWFQKGFDVFLMLAGAMFGILGTIDSFRNLFVEEGGDGAEGGEGLIR